MPISGRFVIRSTALLLAIGFTALLISVLTTLQLSSRAQVYLDQVATSREALVTATRIRESLLASESSQLGYMATSNEIYLAPYETAKSEIGSELTHLKGLLRTRADRAELLDKLSTVVDEKIKDQDAAIGLLDSGRPVDAIDKVRTNRGKALMDEANLYLTAIALESEEQLTRGVAEQTANASWLRWTSIISSLVIIFVVSGVLLTISRYTSEILDARDQVRQANETLESRVIERTNDLARARDRAELLLEEVNHRVANSLALVTSLVRMQTRGLSDPAAKAALEETIGRIQAIAQLHKNLFTSGSVTTVDASSYVEAVISQIETGMVAKGASATLKRSLAPVTLQTNDAINLGIIVTEWVTNAFKYAYPQDGGEIRVRLQAIGDTIEVAVEDDGVGQGDLSQVKGTGLGAKVVSTIAGLMHAEVKYSKRNPGTEARLQMKTGHSANSSN